MAGASIEATLGFWASSLRDVKERMRPLFTQERVAASAGAFLDGLLGNERRKTGWMRAEAAGDPGPWRQQAILGRGMTPFLLLSHRNADRDRHRAWPRPAGARPNKPRDGSNPTVHMAQSAISVVAPQPDDPAG